MPETVEAIFHVPHMHIHVYTGGGGEVRLTHHRAYDVKLTLEEMKRVRHMRNPWDESSRRHTFVGPEGVSLAGAELANHVQLRYSGRQSQTPKAEYVGLQWLNQHAHGCYFGVVHAVRRLPERALVEMEAADRAEQKAAEEAAQKKAAEAEAHSEASSASLRSLDLMLQYGFGELTSDASLLSKLTDEAISPAVRLLCLDMIYLMAAHVAEVQASRFAPADEAAFRQVQQFALSENRYHSAQIRMAERLGQSALVRTHQAAAAAADADLDLENFALKTAQAGLGYLQDKARTHQGGYQGFFTQTNTMGTRTVDAAFEAAATALESQACEIDHLDLPPELLEKLQAQKQQHDTVAVQSTI